MPWSGFCPLGYPLEMPRLLLLVAIGCSTIGWATAQGQVRFRNVPTGTLDRRLELVPQGNENRKLAVQQLFTEAGCSKITEEAVGKRRLPNIVCTIPGERPDLIIVGAHYDADEHGDGAIDNWSGAAILSSLSEALSQDQRRHTFVFAGFSHEEEGLIGSSTYAKKLGKQPVMAMVNIDCLGAGRLAIWVSRADKRLFEMANFISNAMQIPVRGVNVDRAGDTDSHPFVDRKVPVIDFHSLDRQSIQYLHSPLDRLSAIDRSEYHASFKFIAGFLAYLDQNPLTHHRK